MDEQLEWEIKMIRQRYLDLRLSREQGLAVYRMEEADKMPFQDPREHFSHWEEMDYRWDQWNAILDDDQLKLYEASQIEHNERHIAHLVETDARCAKEIPLREEWIEWLKTEFVPGFQRRAIQEYILFPWERDKVEYLRAEYRAYWRRARHSLIVLHYRQARRWQPLTLRLALLRHEEKQYIPDYLSFIEQADEAVRSVAAFLPKKFQHVVQQWAGFFEKEFAASKEHYRQLRIKHFSEEKPVSGWHVMIPPRTDLSPSESAWMTYLLIDLKGANNE